MNNRAPSTLRTKKCVLRPFTMDDASSMLKNWTTDARVTTYLRWFPHKTIEDTNTILTQWVDAYQKPFTYRWAIADINTNEAIGSIDVIRVDQPNEHVEMGYCLGYKYWNKGIMTSALEAVIAFLFNDVRVHRITACHDDRNPASGRVMERVGMRKEGVFLESERSKEGDWINMVHYAILDHEYKNNKK